MGKDVASKSVWAARVQGETLRLIITIAMMC